MGIGGPHVVAFLVAHLSLDSRLRPQPGLDQRTARHGSEPVAADIHIGVVAHHSEYGTPREHQVELASDRVDLPKQGQCMRRGTT